MATSNIPQINLNRSVSTQSVKGIKVNPQNPMTKGQARLLFFAVKELTGARLDLFSVNTPKLVHEEITELCGILKKDSGASQEEQQLAIDILVSDLRVPVLESSQRPISEAGKPATEKKAQKAPKAGKVGISKDDTEPKKMTRAESLAKARAAKKAKAAAVKAEESSKLQQIQAANANGTVPVVKDGQVEVSDTPSEKTADEKLALLVEGLSALIKVVA